MFLDPQNSNQKINLKVLAEHVLKLSDFFIDNPDAQTPWSENYCKLAYRYYYLPLNYLRVEHVIGRGQEVDFFKGLDTTIDWGAGPGTASFALANKLNLNQQYLIEKSNLALKEFQDQHSILKNPKLTSDLDFKKVTSNPEKTILTFSYSLTEMNQMPEGWNQFEALMILEPATEQDGRKLLELRKKLISEGYTIWAPCVHHSDCPLLEKSNHDWCHDRAIVHAPNWFRQLEQYLPFKNKTITTSYLLARKNKPSYDFTNKIRLTGDSLSEKGKTRQLACRGPEREFLTWMNKDIKAQTLPRGDLVTLPAEIEIKSNEIRLKKQI
jgi:ribosomal protein RSM22 (predicted rRNA methylase)